MRHFGYSHIAQSKNGKCEYASNSFFLSGGAGVKRLKLGFSILLFGFLFFSVINCAGDRALNNIMISPQNPSIPAGGTTQFRATAGYNDGTTVDVTTQVTWSSENTSVATINGSGMATSIAAGTTTITATLNMRNSFNDEPNTSVSTILTVTSGVLLQISITPVNSTIGVGKTEHFIATGTYTDATTVDITTQVTWSSSDTTVATIDSGGMATGVSRGTAIIVAALGSISGSIPVTVSIQ